VRRSRLRRRTPLRRRSQKRSDFDRQRRRVVAFVHLRDRSCRAAALVPSVPCSGRLDVHEIIPRSAWGNGALEESNAILLCSAHHRWTHLHPTEAHCAGLRKWSWERQV
jgi:hypothetical protein